MLLAITDYLNMAALQELFTYQPARPLLFNSSAFLLLFLFFYAGYNLVLKTFNLRILYTLLFSLFFYYKCSGHFFWLLILSTVADFALGHFIFNATSKKQSQLFLGLSVVFNLGLLGYFKYTNFVLDSLSAISGANIPAADIFLPVGISFFTFQTMSYSIDVYRGKLVPLTEKITDIPSFFKNLMDFAFFVSFFPQLVAGPIVRAAAFLPQIRWYPELDKATFSRAMFLIMGGLFKKAVISDYISVNFVDRVFENPALYSGAENLFAAYGYAIQIYCDFSGYSDMAIGLALLMGFSLPENFRRPYQAVNIQDFWRRWHISLSTWLRDYLYISLGGNRKGRWRTYLNLMITMLLGGLWHGAGGVFILWGGLHGLALSVDRSLKKHLRQDAFRAYAVLFILHTVGYFIIYLKANTGRLPIEMLDKLLWGNSVFLLCWTLLAALVFVSYSLTGKAKKTGRIVSIILTFHFVTFCWIFFRAGALNAALPPLLASGQMLTQIFTAFNWSIVPQLFTGYSAVIGLIVLGFALHYFPKHWYEKLENQYQHSPVFVKSLALALVIWIVIQSSNTELVPFIYFQF